MYYTPVQNLAHGSSLELAYITMPKMNITWELGPHTNYFTLQIHLSGAALFANVDTTFDI